MNTIQNLFQQAQLAEAAYADLSGAIENQGELQKALDVAFNGQYGGKFSAAQAAAFATEWSVVDQYTATGIFGQTWTGTGFSATLFKNNHTGQYSFAIRGSTGINDFDSDASLIATDGIAVSQLVELYNYWQSLTTSTNSYQAARLTLQVAETASLALAMLNPLTYLQTRTDLTNNDFIIENGNVYKLEWGDSQYVLPGSHIAIGLNKLPADSLVNVDGHSLGGHLAMAFSRLFPDATADATAINGLGFKIGSGNVNNLFSQLGGAATFNPAQIQNVYGIDGPEFASMNNFALQQPGAWDGIYIEDGSLLSAQIGGHSSSQMTDSLAVYNLLATIDPILNTAPNALTRIADLLKAADNIAANTLESVMADLGKLFSVTGAAGFNANEFDSSTSGRDLLYTALKDITAAVPADGGMRLVAADNSILSNAQATTPDATAYRYALVSGNPFALLGADYSAHNINGELDLYDPATGQGQLTDQYLKDRSGYLTAKLRDNTVDSASSTLKDVRYRDLETDTTLNPINTELRKVTLGGAADDGFNGGNGNDSLYGGRGNDELDGGAGNDYLEGNTGDDVLTGGIGNDTMLGGADNDTYHVGQGQDTILDSDGLGAIYLGADKLDGGESRDGGHTWISTDGKHSYALISGDINAADGATIKIDGNLTVQHYHAGDLGLTMSGPAADTVTTNLSIIGDLQKKEFVTTAGYFEKLVPPVPYKKIVILSITGGQVINTYDSAGNITSTVYTDRTYTYNLIDHMGNDITDPGKPYPNRPDALGGSAGNDAIIAGGGDDFLWGLGGDDRLYGGTGIDYLDGGAGDDRLYSESDAPVDIAAAIAQGNAQSGIGTEGDWLNGAAGDDILVGSNASNVLTGGAGDDILIGGAGDDALLGDTNAVAVSFWGQTWHYDTALQDIVFDYKPVLQAPLPDTFSDIDALNAVGPLKFAEFERSLMPGASGNDVLYAGAGNDIAFGGYGNDVIFGEAGDDILQGNSGNDVLLGGTGRDYLYGDILENISTAAAPGDDYLDGGAEDDFIFGNEGNDILIGGSGNDTLEGGAGQDTYIYNVGDGIDHIYDTKSENNILRVGAGVNKDTIKLHLGSLMLDLGNGDEIHIGGFDQTDVFNSSSISSFEFEDGSTLSTTELLARGFDLDGTAGDDQIIGTNTTDRINGLAGDDLLFGGGGDDILNGGTGNDTQTGGDGNDIYLFNRGDGTDTLTDNGELTATDTAWLAPAATDASPLTDNGELTATDTLQFGADILQSDVTITRLGNGDLSFKLNGSTDEVVVQGYYNNALNLIEHVVFGDGSVMTTEDFAGIDSMSGGEGNDVLYGGMFQYGGEGDDVLYGGVYQYGGNGNDSLTYGQLLSGGAGDDTMDGDDYDTGRMTRYLIDPTQTGVDLIRDTGDSEVAYKGWYYGVLGIADWEVRDAHSGQYSMPGDLFDSTIDVRFDKAVVDWLLDPNSTVDTFPDSYIYDRWGSWAWPGVKAAILADPSILHYIEPLPLMNRPAAYDYAALQPAYDAGAVPLDTVEFSAGVTLADLQLSWGEITQVSPVSGVDEPYRTLVLSWNGGASQVQLVIPHADDPLGSGVEQIRFADGTIVGMQGLIAKAPPVTSIDPHYSDLTLIGTEGADDLTGMLGNDTLIGLGGDDQLNGGGGNDVLNGGAGNDRYVFRLGDGADVVDDRQGNDTLFIGSDLTVTDVEASRSGDDLIMAVTGAPDSVTITNWFIQTEGVNRIEFCDGAALDRAGIASLLNAPPVANPDTVTVTEDSSISVIAAAGLLSNDTDPDVGDTLSFAGFDTVTAQGNTVTQDANGNFVLDIGNQYQLLGAGQAATDSFTYTIADAAGETSTATADITIFGANDVPVAAMPIAFQQTDEDAPFSFSIPAGTFTDIDNGDTLAYSATLADGGALPAWLTFDAATQTFIGTPANGDVGDLNVLVTATDTGGLSASSAFSLNVANVNDAPAANADTANAIEDGGAVLLDAATLLANDPDPDLIHGDVLNITDVSQAASGAAVSLAGGAVQYDPGTLFQSLAQGQTATDTFSYTVSDAAGATSTATVTITVAGINDGPVAADDAAAVQEDLTLVATGNVLTNDSDADQGTVLNVANAGTLQGSYGSLILNADGSYTYQIDNAGTAVQGLMAGQSVTETFAYQTTDGIATTPATLTVTITGSNDAPLAQDDVATVDEDNLLAIQPDALLANDTDPDSGDTKTLAGVDSLSALGAAVSFVNGQVIYDQSCQFNSLMAGQSVMDSFGYTMTDSAGAVSGATVNVTVTGVNDGPQANGDSAATDEDTAQTILTAASLLANDTDPDTGDVISIAAFDAVTALGNTIGMDAQGNLVFDLSTSSRQGAGDRYQSLAQGETITDTFGYTVTDTAGATSTAQISMSISGVNDAPVAAADTAYVQEDLAPASGNVLANDSDVDQGTLLTAADAGTRQGSYGQLALAADGNYSYTLDNPSTGSGQAVQSMGRTAQAIEHFGYTATDGLTGTASVLDIFIAGANDAPILVTPLADLSITSGKAFTWQMPDTSFTDIDQGDTLDYAATQADGTALPDWLSFDAATRTFSGTAPKQGGSVDIKMTATDKVAATGSTEGSLSASDTFHISFGHGNEGVGNGEDSPPPGHHCNQNDGSGTSPGHTGSQGGNGQHASGDDAHGRDDDHDHDQHKDDSSSHGDRDSDSHRTEELIRSWFEQESRDERYAPFGATGRNGGGSSQTDWQVKRNVAEGISGDYRTEWARMDAQLKEHLAQAGGDSFAEFGTDTRPPGLFGSGGSQSLTQPGIGTGQQMKEFAGLGEGLVRLGC